MNDVTGNEKRRTAVAIEISRLLAFDKAVNAENIGASYGYYLAESVERMRDENTRLREELEQARAEIAVLTSTPTGRDVLAELAAAKGRVVAYREALALTNCMVLCGEKHSGRSKKIVDDALSTDGRAYAERVKRMEDALKYISENEECKRKFALKVLAFKEGFGFVRKQHEEHMNEYIGPCKCAKCIAKAAVEVSADGST